MGYTMNAHAFPYEWTLEGANFTKDKGTVFSCFACGGGSTMGYKLAGFDVIGCNEIDSRMMEAYRANHKPRFSYLEPIQQFKNRDDLPPELYDLDILDGSPPCSSFSMAGNREKDWGKDKKFREGQAEQVLDTLFFDFIELADNLKPKVVIAENVKGMLMGAAQKYVDKVLRCFNAAGYYVSYKLLDASRMGVPQKRERVFFYAIRKDLYAGTFDDLFQSEPVLNLEFNEPQIPFAELGTMDDETQQLNTTESARKYWAKTELGASFSVVASEEKGKPSHFNWIRVHPSKPLPTLSTENGKTYHPSIMRPLNNREYSLGGSYPQDYNYACNKVGYIVGMSVPPVMTAQVATRVYDQWLRPIKEKP
jgi:DNA (cytosine-5)-methyltransferase 1